MILFLSCVSFVIKYSLKVPGGIRQMSIHPRWYTDNRPKIIPSNSTKKSNKIIGVAYRRTMNEGYLGKDGWLTGNCSAENPTQSR